MKCFEKIYKIIDYYAEYCRDNDIIFEDIVEKASAQLKDELKQTTLSDTDIEGLLGVKINLLRSRVLRFKLEKNYRLNKVRAYKLETDQYLKDLEEFEERSKETKIRIGSKECGEDWDEPGPFSIKSFPEQLDFGK